MKCPVCGQAELVADTRDLPHPYKGQLKVIQNVGGEFCPACYESVLNADESRRVMDLMGSFYNEVNAKFVATSAALKPISWPPPLEVKRQY